MDLHKSETFAAIPTTPPPEYAVVTAAEPIDDAEFVERATAWIPQTPVVRERSPPQLRPVAIPRIDIAGRLAMPLPFMRAYSPDLKPYGIDEREFVAFIDNLAVAQAAPAPFQVLDAAGHVIGFVPHHWALFAGIGMNVAAGVGTAAVAYGRTRYFMEKVNREYFAPRGLRVSLCKYQQLLEKLAITTDTAVSGDRTFSLRDRCMLALQPHVASLTLDVPPPSNERNILDRIAMKGIERKRRKREKKHNKKYWKPQGDGYSSDSSSSSSSSSSLSSSSSSDDDEAQHKTARRTRKINRKAEKRLTKHPEKAARIEEKRLRKFNKMENKVVRRADKATRKADKNQNKDSKKAKRMEFVFIETLE